MGDSIVTDVPGLMAATELSRVELAECDPDDLNALLADLSVGVIAKIKIKAALKKSPGGPGGGGGGGGSGGEIVAWRGPLLARSAGMTGWARTGVTRPVSLRYCWACCALTFAADVLQHRHVRVGQSRDRN